MDGKVYDEFVYTGPGTLCGRYLRLFWQPVYRACDLAPGHAVTVEIMSEKLTVYRGEGGEPHVVTHRCAHRGTQLSTGWVEGDCIRCLYHGWKYDATGQCVEQPGEDPAAASHVRIRAYPTREYLGLIFAYLGEGEPLPLRRFLDFEAAGVLAAGVPEYWPCNYFNRIDNASDGAHVPWTHRESLRRVGTQLPIVGARQSEETEYGVRSTTIAPGRPVSYIHFHWPNINQNRSFARVEGSLEDAANLYVDRLFWRVPVNDYNSVSFVVDLVPLTGDAGEAYRERRRKAEEDEAVDLRALGDAILAGKTRLRDMDPNISIYKLFWLEDYVAQCGQGPIPDRSQDRLVGVDRGVALIRKIYERELRRLAAGQPPKEWKSVSGLQHTAEPEKVTSAGG